MPVFLSKYYAIARTNFKNSLFYLWDFFGGSVFIMILVFIFFFFWLAVFKNIDGGVIGGFTLTTMMWYFIFAEAIHMSHGKLIEEVGREVKSGDVVNYLNKPYNYLLYKYSMKIAEEFISFGLTLFLGVVIVVLCVGFIQIDPIHLPFVIILAFLGLSLHFAMMIVLGLIAFWTEDAESAQFIYTKMTLLIGGTVIPLDLFPQWAAEIAKLLPFSFVAYYPAKLFVNFNFFTFLSVVLSQVLWIAFFSVIAIFIFSKLSRRLSVNGG